MRKLLMILFVVSFAFTFAACGNQGSTTESVENAVEEAADHVEDAVDDAANAVEDAVEDATDAVEEAADDVEAEVDSIEVSE